MKISLKRKQINKIWEMLDGNVKGSMRNVLTLWIYHNNCDILLMVWVQQYCELHSLKFCGVWRGPMVRHSENKVPYLRRGVQPHILGKLYLSQSMRQNAIMNLTIPQSQGVGAKSSCTFISRCKISFTLDQEYQRIWLGTNYLFWNLPKILKNMHLFYCQKSERNSQAHSLHYLVKWHNNVPSTYTLKQSWPGLFTKTHGY